MLDKYKTVLVINSAQKALALSLALEKLPKNLQRERFAGSRKAGYFYLFRDDAIDPKVVMECVVSPEGGDAITSVYGNDPFNAELGTWVRAREELIETLARKIGLSIENVGIEDPARGRTMGLQELATGALIDLLAEKMGSSIITSDSHVVGDALQPGVLTVGPDGSMRVA